MQNLIASDMNTIENRLSELEDQLRKFTQNSEKKDNEKTTMFRFAC